MCKRGDIYIADLGKNSSGVQDGVRPVLIVSNNAANNNSPVVTIAPFTTRIKKPNQPTHVYVSRRQSGLEVDSLLLAEQIQTVNKSVLICRLGRIKDSGLMHKITQALQVQVGVFEKVD